MRTRRSLQNNRGVALLIVLLVTALLIALIFEFAYGTRVSLRGAANFRDSQRAYFLARSGVAIFTKFADMKDLIPQGELQEVPYISAGDAVVRVRWEDEQGKLNVNYVTSTHGYDWVAELFSGQGVSTAVVDQVKDLRKEGQLKLVADLRRVMSDEDYDKVAMFLTVSSDGKININTASEEVLNSVLANNRVAVGMIVNSRKNKHIEKLGDIGLSTSTYPFLDTTSGALAIHSYATVGGYTRMITSIGTSYWSVQ